MISYAKPVIAAVLAALFAAAIPAAAADSIYVIRHLQKAEGEDPGLTPEGAAGASALADLLADKGIQAVFATPTRRAIQTGTPLAVQLGLPVRRYDPANPAALIEAAREIPGNILVVGHSNTVPELVAQFGGERPAPLTEQDYGTLFLVTPASRQVTQISVGGAAK